MVNKDQTTSASIHETALEVAPSKARDKSRRNERHDQEHLHIPAVLELNDGITRQIAHISNTRFPAGLEHHPADMRPEQAVLRSVRIQVGICVTMMGTMATRPPFDGALDGARACEGESVFKGLGSVIGTMGPETMVSRGNSQTFRREKNSSKISTVSHEWEMKYK